MPLEIELEVDNLIDNNNVIDKLAQIPENDQSNSNVMIIINPHEECNSVQTIEEERPTQFNGKDQGKKINIKTIYTPNVCRLQEKIRRYQKLLNKKKRAIQKKKKHENEWEKIMKNTSQMQSTFLDIIRKNYNSLPQVCC